MTNAYRIRNMTNKVSEKLLEKFNSLLDENEYKTEE